MPSSRSAGKAAKVIKPTDPATIKHLVDSLRRMGNKRPVKSTSLRRALKSFLGAKATEAHVEQALGHLTGQGVVAVDPAKGVSYPSFAGRSAK